MKLTKKAEDKEAMLNAEKLLAYDPGNTDRMVSILQSAHKAGFYDTVFWIGPILQKANVDSKKPDFNKFMILKNTYEQLEEYKLATDACHYARTLKPDDMDLQQELKNLAAKGTMKKGKYGTAKTFRDSVRDKDLQDRLIEQERDVHAEDVLVRGIREAEVEWQNSPDDWGKFSKLIDALRRPEQLEFENRAIELLENAFQKTGQFKWRQRVGEIKMAQLSRQERGLRAELEKNRTDPELIQRYKEFRLERAKLEMAEFQLILDHYPTDSSARYNVAVRMFELGQHQEAIPVFQHVRSDPKYRVNATVLLGQSFLAAGFMDEAVDTLKGVIDEYPARGDERSIKMYYWYGRALEEKKDIATALKAYSQVAQWNFNFGDVQARIKKLRVQQ
jgi:tetratricopeptide (TPR) repeat protein